MAITTGTAVQGTKIIPAALDIETRGDQADVVTVPQERIVVTQLDTEIELSIMTTCQESKGDKLVNKAMICTDSFLKGAVQDSLTHPQL